MCFRPPKHLTKHPRWRFPRRQRPRRGQWPSASLSTCLVLQLAIGSDAGGCRASRSSDEQNGVQQPPLGRKRRTSAVRSPKGTGPRLSGLGSSLAAGSGEGGARPSDLQATPNGASLLSPRSPPVAHLADDGPFVRPAVMVGEVQAIPFPSSSTVCHKYSTDAIGSTSSPSARWRSS